MYWNSIVEKILSSSNDPSSFPRRNIINPPTNLDTLRETLMALQIPNITLHSTLQFPKRQEIKAFIDFASIPPHSSFGILVRKNQHAAPSVLDQHDLARPKQVLRDQDRS